LIPRVRRLRGDPRAVLCNAFGQRRERFWHGDFRYLHKLGNRKKRQTPYALDVR
jgi:hypothetical protein